MSENKDSNSSNIITISLKDMNRYIFKEKRKFMIILMLIFAILFGLIRGVTSFRNVGKIPATKEEIASEETYRQTKQNYLDDIDKTNEKIAAETEYQQNSVLYNIDAANVYRGNLIYSILPSDGSSVNSEIISSEENTADSTSNNGVKTLIYSSTDSRMKSVLLSYVSYIKNADFYKSIDEKTDAKYIRELVLVTADVQSDMIFISIVGDTEDLVSKLSKAVQKEMGEKTAEIQKANSNYQISLISEAYYTTNDSVSSSVNSPANFGTTFSNGEFINVFSIKKTHNDTMTGYNDVIAADNNALNNLQDPNIDIEKVQTSDAATATVKAAVEGLLLGFILAFLILMIRYCHGKEKEKN
jgi:hypothetical protein